MNRPFVTLPLVVFAGFVVMKGARLLSPDGGLDAAALLLAVAIAGLIAFTFDGAVKRPRGR